MGYISLHNADRKCDGKNKVEQKPQKAFLKNMQSKVEEK